MWKIQNSLQLLNTHIKPVNRSAALSLSYSPKPRLSNKGKAGMGKDILLRDSKKLMLDLHISLREAKNLLWNLRKEFEVRNKWLSKINNVDPHQINFKLDERLDNLATRIAETEVKLEKDITEIAAREKFIKSRNIFPASC